MLYVFGITYHSTLFLFPSGIEQCHRIFGELLIGAVAPILLLHNIQARLTIGQVGYHHEYKQRSGNDFMHLVLSGINSAVWCLDRSSEVVGHRQGGAMVIRPLAKERTNGAFESVKTK